MINDHKLLHIKYYDILLLIPLRKLHRISDCAGLYRDLEAAVFSGQ